MLNTQSVVRSQIKTASECRDNESGLCWTALTTLNKGPISLQLLKNPVTMIVKSFKKNLDQNYFSPYNFLTDDQITQKFLKSNLHEEIEQYQRYCEKNIEQNYTEQLIMLRSYDNLVQGIAAKEMRIEQLLELKEDYKPINKTFVGQICSILPLYPEVVEILNDLESNYKKGNNNEKRRDFVKKVKALYKKLQKMNWTQHEIIKHIEESATSKLLKKLFSECGLVLPDGREQWFDILAMMFDILAMDNPKFELWLESYTRRLNKLEDFMGRHGRKRGEKYTLELEVLSTFKQQRESEVTAAIDKRDTELTQAFNLDPTISL